VDRATALFQEVFLHALTIPALNKWTTVAPSMTLVAAMQQCYDVVPQAFGRCFARGQAEESSDDSGGEDAALGVPRDQTKQWRKLARKRQKKAAFFLQDQESRFLTMLWGIVTFCVMTVHYSLFKRGTWLTERVEDETDANLSFFLATQQPVQLPEPVLRSLRCWTLSRLTPGFLWLVCMGLCSRGRRGGCEAPGAACLRRLASCTGSCLNHGNVTPGSSWNCH
jgi:hypothetical protein